MDLQGSQWCQKQLPQRRGCRGHKQDSIREKKENNRKLTILQSSWKKIQKTIMRFGYVSLES